MANFYVGADGIIHSGNGGRGTVSVTTNSNGAGGMYNQTYYNTTTVGPIRKGFYWLFTLAAGVLIGIGVYQWIGASIFAQFEAESASESIINWLYGITPYAFIAGGFLGSLFSGLIYAEDYSYNLQAIFFALVASVIGLLIVSLGIGAIVIIVKLIAAVIKVIVVIAIVAAIVGAFGGN